MFGFHLPVGKTFTKQPVCHLSTPSELMTNIHITGKAESLRLNYRPYKYILAIMGEKPEEEGSITLNSLSIPEDSKWQKKFCKEVRTGDLLLKEGEIWGRHFTRLGKYRFISAEDAPKK